MKSFIAIVSLFFLVYAAACYYAGLRLYQSWGGVLAAYAGYYWGCYVLLASTPLISPLGRGWIPRWLNGLVAVAGNYWLAALYYLVVSWALVDSIRLAGGLLWPAAPGLPPAWLGAAVTVTVGCLLAYGVWNGRNPRICRYEVTIRKSAGGLTGLRAVLVADIHLGLIVGKDRLTAMVDQINRLNPDIVFLAGDTIDEDAELFIERKMATLLKRLTPRYGVYAVLGNHEYLGGQALLAVQALEQAGVQVLRDRYVKVNEQFYVVGRDDPTVARMEGAKRLTLPAVMQGIDRSLPVILLDHQPQNLTEGQQQGVDLQLSGHTHHGQFFPNNLVTERLFELDWGYLRKGAYQVIVSCGYGTWGPPVRIGNQPEIVDIRIIFKSSAG
ncbi:metallophosphoesterase [Sporomusa termitida]|uniref:Calcineurin-like phosphoeSPTERase n=1 Tax=Sporomusa termitida TaxID=2377 RepID=A0A517DYB6_9FIRM|nr:metallophosphoesterase [Sporomusa termitida]QDR82236.1 Calcineurin-like phosphoeSPTERase [Sporomusa termitida]